MIREIGREGTVWVSVWCLATLLCMTSHGCGSALATSARGVETTARLLAPTMDAAVSVRRVELDACERLPVGEDLACVDAGEAAWRPRVDALNGARDALVAVLDGLDAAHAGGTGAPTHDALVGLARAALAAWLAAGAMLQPAGVALPSLPPEVVALIGGAT